jgi:hypothetical protein
VSLALITFEAPNRLFHASHERFYLGIGFIGRVGYLFDKVFQFLVIKKSQVGVHSQVNHIFRQRQLDRIKLVIQLEQLCQRAGSNLISLRAPA